MHQQLVFIHLFFGVLGASPSCHITPTTGTYIEYAPTKAIHKNCIVAKAIFQSKLYCCTGKLYCCHPPSHGYCCRPQQQASLAILGPITTSLWLTTLAQIWRCCCHAVAAVRCWMRQRKKRRSRWCCMILSCSRNSMKLYGCMHRKGWIKSRG